MNLDQTKPKPGKYYVFPHLTSLHLLSVGHGPLHALLQKKEKFSLHMRITDPDDTPPAWAHYR